jgi:hypothetical protein
MKARSKGEKAFPSNDIQSLVEIASRVVAHNFELYPTLEGLTDKDENVKEAIVKTIQEKENESQDKSDERLRRRRDPYEQEDQKQ